MIKDGREYRNSRRCDFCRDCGSYLDTGMCELCEQGFAEKTAPLRTDLAAVIQRAKRFEAAYGEMVATAKAELEAGTAARIDRQRLTVERDAALRERDALREALANLIEAVDDLAEARSDDNAWTFVAVEAALEHLAERLAAARAAAQAISAV